MPVVPRITFETVDLETPASSATSRIVGCARRSSTLVPLPVMVSRFWRVRGVARQGRREPAYQQIRGRPRTPHGGAGRRQKRTDYCWEGHLTSVEPPHVGEVPLLDRHHCFQVAAADGDPVL